MDILSKITHLYINMKDWIEFHQRSTQNTIRIDICNYVSIGTMWLTTSQQFHIDDLQTRKHPVEFAITPSVNTFTVLNNQSSFIADSGSA